ncbi:teichoic acid transporter [Sphingobium jiangsuense]|uniref:O-antigen/teichoic acid export membrane protein n=1 Tax=Sphingobium jiangsuense TaxID=870476 RepID=A0A7W6BIH6_9SPHN|nr:oligosaccharide flippase family protein [Sphingobium jiangsuense]MBB3927620.1 O-antigen/teichoic acid export membrane protein [Sphingobium jiangsuense]GLS98725.1 teichoic acid transporter [Sphingobium jiangsuense]
MIISRLFRGVPGQDKTGKTPGPLSKVGQNLAWLLAGKGLGAILSILYLGLATRILGPAGFGQFALIFGLAQTISGIASFQSWRLIVLYGHDTGTIDTGLKETACKDGVGIGPASHSIDAIANFGFKLDLTAATIGCVLAAIGVHFLAEPIGWDQQLTRTAMIFAVITLLAIRSSAVGILRLYDRFRDGAAADAVMPLTRMVGAMIAALFFPTVTGFLVAWAASEVTTAIAYWWMVNRNTPVRIHPWSSPSMRSVIKQHPGIIHFALVTNAGSTLTALIQNLPLLAIGAFTTPMLAGLYRLANQLAQAMMRIADMLSRAVYPELAKIRAHQGQDAAHDLTRRTTLLALIGGIVVLLLTIFAGKLAIRIVAGPQFVAAYPILILLGVGVAIELAGVALEPMLTASNRAGRVLAIRMIATLALAGALAILLPHYGVIGAGWATLIASAISLALFTISVRRLRTR